LAEPLCVFIIPYLCLHTFTRSFAFADVADLSGITFIYTVYLVGTYWMRVMLSSQNPYLSPLPF